MGKAIFDAIDSLSMFQAHGYDKGDDVNSGIEKADFVIIAVKPQSFPGLAQSIEVDLNYKMVISIMAGVSIENISEKLSAKRVVRVMPNLPLKVGHSLSAWCCNEKIEEDAKVTIKSILGVFGEEIEVDDESQIDVVTALAGSGPAYYYRLNQAVKRKAIALGFTEKKAKKIVRSTFLGAAKLFEEGELCSSELIEKISSKGGTTEAALGSLEEAEFDRIIGDAVQSAFDRAKELNES